MRKRFWLMLLLAATGAAAIALYFGCSTNSSSSDDQSVTMNITVQRDDLFGLPYNDVIGQAKFDRHSGQVGLYVNGQVYLKALSLFPDQQINMRLELENQDAAQQPWAPIEWVQQGNLQDIQLVIPLVETIPTLLNFRVVASYYQYSSAAPARPAVGAADGDDASPTDDDASPADDDASPTDDDATPADDDATPVDDDATPSKVFDAEAIYLFHVNQGGAITR